MAIWTAELKGLEKFHGSLKGHLPDLDKELERLLKAEDENMILLYSRRCLEVIITDLCEGELKRPRKTEPLKGIVDKLHKEEKVPSYIISSMHSLNELSTYGAHPKDFDPEQVKPVLNNLDIIIKWYLKYKETGADIKAKPVEDIRHSIKGTEDANKSIQIPKKKLIGLVSGLILLIVIVILVLFLTKIIGDGKQIKELEKSIAVLPFINESPVDSNKHFINGVMEEILNNLQTIKEFRVLSRTSTDQYKGPDRPTMPEIARKLDVSYIVEGSGQKYGNIFTLRVQLIKAKGKESHIWGKTYNEEIREVRDYVRIQSQIAQAIAAELKAVITPEEKQLIEKTPTANLTAYDFYKRGREYWIDNRDREALQKAEDLYNQALQYDSTYAQAYTGVAWVYWDKHYMQDYLSENFMDSVLILCNIALSFDNQLSEAHTLKGTYYSQIGKPELAIEEFDKAIKSNPNDWMAYSGKGGYYYETDWINYIKYLQKAASINHGPELPGLLSRIVYAYASAGFYEKARQYQQDKLKLDGDSANYYAELARYENWLGNFNKSIEFGIKCYAIDSTNATTLIILGGSYARLGRYKESLKYYKKFIERSKIQGSEWELSSMHRVGYSYWQNGYKEEAEYYFNEQINYNNGMIKFKRLVAQMLYPYYDLAGVYAFRGERDKAYENLRIFNNKPIMSSWMVSLIKTDPLFNSIRNEPEFQQIVRDVEAKYQAEHERVQKWLEEQGML